MLAQAMRVSSGANHPIEPALGNRIVEAVLHSARPIMGQARSFAIVTSPVARRALARLFKPHLPETPVLSFLNSRQQAGRSRRCCRGRSPGRTEPTYGAACVRKNQLKSGDLANAVAGCKGAGVKPYILPPVSKAPARRPAPPKN